MKYRVYNDNNWNARMGQYMATYFKTKREAKAYAEQTGNATIERKVVDTWVQC